MNRKKLYSELSVDIETLGTNGGDVVLSIGAVAFDLTGVSKRRLSVSICVIDSLLHGLRIDPDTLDWWRRQSSDAQAALRKDSAMPLVEAADALTAFFDKNCSEECRVWMKGPSFDGVLLKGAFAKIDRPLPWKYYRERDVRTICDNIAEPERNGTHHSATDDAVHQACWVRDALFAKQVLTVEGGPENAE